MDIGGVNPAEWQRLLDRANAGELTLDPDAAKNLDKVCDTYLDRLDGVLDAAHQVGVVQGFGPFPSGQALQQKFSLKGTGTPQSIDAIIKEHIETVKLIKQVVAKSIANAEAVDQENSQRIVDTGSQ
ncbi:hypothetical protein [Nocardia donostiensis]|uniref:Uncharacterized protein n=1 Tax=Nocardia donostiensis TaxID=1538463 RepID=A0A1W0BK53_9NOCA|nr:hypothetical protein [Nocardia donostiensis]ONM48887.1 hypothetical protein B0T46_10485 [Nocardia donostiensis]OQS22858.1 hypothetical protein B0T44_03980 [Nocardia donostiensis]